MHHRLALSVAALLFVGLGSVACGDETAPSNRPPILNGPFVQTPDVTSGTPVELSLEATDADGDTLTYEWVQTPTTPAGTFSDPSLPNPTWTAPQVTAATSFQLGVAVSDGKASTIRRSVTILVRPQPPTNRPPVITTGTPTASPSSVASSVSVQLSVTAADLDDDRLTYSWSQEPATPVGSFSSLFVSNPTWTAPAVTADTTFQLRVTVSDGQGGVASGTVSVTVRAPANRPPTISQAPSANPTSVTGSAPVQLSVTAADADGDTLSYTWTQQPATPAGSFSSATVSNPTWTSPVVTTATRFTLGVTISDGRGGSVQGTVDVDVAPPIPANNPPTLTGPTANPTTLDYQQSTTLSLTASDADGDTLSYAWTQQPATPAGTFSSTTAADPTWTAPRVTTNTAFQLSVTVSDGRGGSANGAASVNVNAFVNSPPTITAGPSASATTINEQQSITLSVSASDANNDPLTYAWTQTSPASPVGTFSDASVANPTWTAPDVTANGTYTLQVTVSDGQGGSAQGTIDITVQKVNQPPTVGATITGPATLLAGDTGTFSITASDPDGDTLTYAWSQTTPATPQGTWVTGTTGSSAQWYSPALGTQTTFTLAVSVTDGQSDPVVRTIDVPVTVPRYTNVQSIWDSRCTGCHGTSGGLSLAAGSSHANLVNVPANACVPLNRVTPNDPDNSALVQKMSGTACGARMPRDDAGYFDQNPGLIIRVRSWILAGALND